jgi:hypothetical protein
LLCCRVEIDLPRLWIDQNSDDAVLEVPRVMIFDSETEMSVEMHNTSMVKVSDSKWNAWYAYMLIVYRGKNSFSNSLILAAGNPSISQLY